MSSTINHSCKTLYGGIILQSYILILTNVVIFAIIQFFAEEFLLPKLFELLGNNCVSSVTDPLVEKTEIKSNTKPKSTITNSSCDLESNCSQIINPISNGNQNESDIYPMSIELSSLPIETKDTNEIKNSFRVKLAFLFFQAIFGIGSLVICIMNIDHSKSNWNNYQDFYGKLLNSSALTLLVSIILFATNSDTISNNYMNYDTITNIMGMFFLIWIIIFFPTFYTHIILGIIIYFWVFFPLLLMIVFFTLTIMLTINYLVKTNNNDDERIQQKVVNMTMSVMFRLITIAFMQTCYNYMYIFYQIKPEHTYMSGEQYISVITTEYEYRTQTYCEFEHAVSSIQYGMVFFSWL